MTTSYYRKRDAIIIVFDLTDKATLEDLVEWIEEARQRNPDAYTVIVGNKSDHPKRTVSPEDGASVASNHGMPYFETSAKNADVDKIFDHLAEVLSLTRPGIPLPLATSQQNKPTPKKCCK